MSTKVVNVPSAGPDTAPSDKTQDAGRAELKEMIERLRDVSEWKALIEQHRRKTDDPAISYVLKDGTKIHEDDSIVAKLAASLSRALENASDVASDAADLFEDAMGGSVK